MSARTQAGAAVSAVSAQRFLETLYAGAPVGSFIELRYRSGSGMGRAFYDASRLNAVAATITERSSHTDVFVGVIPRRRRGGGRDDLVRQASVVWVDCDTADSAVKLRRFAPGPSVIVQSGTAGNLHGYWLLSEAGDLDAIESTNRRLARAIGADAACADAARILRPIGSTNHKQGRATLVRGERCDSTARYRLGDITEALSDLDQHRSWRPVRSPRTTAGADQLRSVAPRIYVERLTGVMVPRHGKIRCPFHADRTPSLHVYSAPEGGWYCYGCGRGGSIYDFAALLWGLRTRGADFRQLQRALGDTFGLDLKTMVA